MPTIAMNLELRNHPAQARHRLTDEPLFYDDGSPVPLIPEMRALYKWRDGDGTPQDPPRWIHIGYCGDKAGKPLSLCYHEENKEVVQAYMEFVAKEVGPPSGFQQPISQAQIAILEKTAAEQDDEIDTDFEDEDD